MTGNLISIHKHRMNRFPVINLHFIYISLSAIVNGQHPALDKSSARFPDKDVTPLRRE